MKKRNRSSYEQIDSEKKSRRGFEEEKPRTVRKKRDLRKEERARKRKERARNKEFARVTYFFVGLFLFLMGYIVYFQLVRAEEFNRSAYNQRQDSLADRVTRGKILDKNGNVLAESSYSDDGTETRSYPYKDLFAHVVGYTAKGKVGLESVENSALLTSNLFITDKLKNAVQDQKNPGDNVVTTLDTDLQQAAYRALGKDKGAVIAIEPSTGKILAMVSKPCFDPNTVKEDWEELNGDTNGILLNRVTQGQYAPGSTFKLVTLLEYMRENHAYSTYTYDCTGSIAAGPKNTIHCFHGAEHGEVDLRDSLAYSCNTSFSSIGATLDRDRFHATAKELLFNKKLPSELSFKKSSFRLSEHAGEAEKMMTAIGQGETQVSPYHMALITCAIANQGILMKPYLVEQIQNASGTVISRTKSTDYATLLSAEEADALKYYMTGVTEYGTAKVLGDLAYTVAGKTGTAEYSSDKEKDHSWFVGMSDVDAPDLVVSVVIEASDGTSKAVSVAKEVFDTYYR